MIRNLQPMLAGIEKSGFGACFHLYVLSDTSDPHIAAIEKERFTALAERLEGPHRGDLPPAHSQHRI